MLPLPVGSAGMYTGVPVTEGVKYRETSVELPMGSEQVVEVAFVDNMESQSGPMKAASCAIAIA